MNIKSRLKTSSVALLMVAVVSLLIIPLPTAILDFMFILNLTISLVILFITMYIKETLEFAIFPSLLLVTTVYRLSLNISSTRSILTNSGYAGEVVKTFGEFVIQGNIVVGLIIFLILGVTLAVSIGIPYDFMLYNWIALPSFSVIILILGSMSLEKMSHSKMLNYLSSISFTFFLCQVLPLWGICRRIVEHLNLTNNGLKIIISFAICFVGAILIHELIEKPSVKILRKKLL